MKNNFANKLVSTDGLSKKEWLKWRQKGIGGSDVASICGINPYHSALACYYDKTEKISELEAENIPAELGLFLEPFIATKFEKWFKENEGYEIIVGKPNYIFQHPTNKIALANLDGYFIHPKTGKECIVEYKTTSVYNYENWVDENIPDYYYLQIQWYLYVMDVQTCYLAYLVGNNKFDVTVIERNDEVIEQIIVKTNDFWKNFVEKKVPPAPDGSISSKEILDKMYENVEVGKEVVINEPEYIGYLKSVKNLKSKIKDLKGDLQLNEQLIKEKIGTAEKAKCGEYTVTWKEQTKKEHLVKESKFRILRIKTNKGEIK